LSHVFAAFQIEPTNAVSIKRILSGYGQEHGSIGVFISNPHSHPVPAIWLEELPWWIRLYMHSLTIQLSQAGNITLISKSHGWFEQLHYKPAQDRISPSVIEASFQIPPESTLRISVDFDKGYLRYTEFPPDAHRGFAIPSAILAYRLPGQSKQVRTYSTTSLLSSPLPDFSMPYNVIVLTSTVIALIFGSLFNMMFREFVAVDLKAEPVKKKVG
jgi:phosphatidylinositol glycan class T